MTIAMECPGCQRRLSAPANAAGKRVKCPNCQTLMIVPAPVEEAGFEVVEDDFEVVDDDEPVSGYGVADEKKADAKRKPKRRVRRFNNVDGVEDEVVQCPKCDEENDPDARRCDECGATLRKGDTESDSKSRLKTMIRDDYRPRKKRKYKPVKEEGGVFSFEKKPALRRRPRRPARHARRRRLVHPRPPGRPHLLLPARAVHHRLRRDDQRPDGPGGVVMASI